MCLATSLFIVIRHSLSYDIDPVGRALFLLLSLVWDFGLDTWMQNLRRASEDKCNKSMIGGLIAATNLGVLYISLYPGMSLENKVSHVAWPTWVCWLGIGGHELDSCINPMRCYC